MKTVARLIFCLFPVITLTLSHAGEISDNTVTPPSDETEIIDKTHDVVTDSFLKLADKIDMFFGDERIQVESSGNRMKVDMSTIFEKQGERKFLANVRIRLALPRTKERVNLVIESDPEELRHDDPENISNAETSPKKELDKTEYSAALQYILKERKKWNFRASAGIKLHIPLDPFTRFRAQRTFTSTYWLTRFTETVFWFESIGLGESSNLDLERPLSQALFFRATSNATWKHRKDLFELSQTFSLFQTINSKLGISYLIGAFGETKPNTHITSYLASATIRKLIHKDWMYFQITPKAFFPEDDNFELSPSITFTLEANMGD